MEDPRTWPTIARLEWRNLKGENAAKEFRVPFPVAFLQWRERIWQRSATWREGQQPVPYAPFSCWEVQEEHGLLSSAPPSISTPQAIEEVD